MHSYLIAFSKKPKAGFLDVLYQMSANDGVEIKAAVLTEGPGCANLAIALEERNDRYADALTMALMPAKYEGSEGLLHGLILDTFVDEINTPPADDGPDTVFDVRRPA